MESLITFIVDIMKCHLSSYITWNWSLILVFFIGYCTLLYRKHQFTVSYYSNLLMHYHCLHFTIHSDQWSYILLPKYSVHDTLHTSIFLIFCNNFILLNLNENHFLLVNDVACYFLLVNMVKIIFFWWIQRNIFLFLVNRGEYDQFYSSFSVQNHSERGRNYSSFASDCSYYFFTGTYNII